MTRRIRNHGNVPQLAGKLPAASGCNWPVTATDAHPPNCCNASEADAQPVWANVN